MTRDDLLTIVELDENEPVLICDTCGSLHADDADAASESCHCGRFKPRMEWAKEVDLIRNLKQLARTLLAVLDAVSEPVSDSYGSTYTSIERNRIRDIITNTGEGK